MERQTLSGIPDFQALLFTIRTYFYEVTELKDYETEALISAIGSMSPDSLRYIGMNRSKDDIISYLKNLIAENRRTRN